MITNIQTPTMLLLLADEPTEIDLAALQGLWTEAQYLRLGAQTNRLLEFTDGVIEVPPMPNDRHQAISLLLIQLLLPVVRARSGTLRHAPLSLRIRPGKYREPDLLLLLASRDPRKQSDFWRGADLVIEIVSPDNPERDRRVKRADYAEAGIPEYWIVDPLTETITVLRLAGAQYVEHGIFRRGDHTTSVLLPECAVLVNEVLDAE
jgi:Uma2 family endonuclease